MKLHTWCAAVDINNPIITRSLLTVRLLTVKNGVLSPSHMAFTGGRHPNAKEIVSLRRSDSRSVYLVPDYQSTSGLEYFPVMDIVQLPGKEQVRSELYMVKIEAAAVVQTGLI